MHLWSRLRHWMRRRQFEADLAEEIRIHREMEQDYRAAGREGRFFGSEALALEQSREAWGFAWLDSFAQDIREPDRGYPTVRSHGLPGRLAADCSSVACCEPAAGAAGRGSRSALRPALRLTS